MNSGWIVFGCTVLVVLGTVLVGRAGVRLWAFPGRERLATSQPTAIGYLVADRMRSALAALAWLRASRFVDASAGVLCVSGAGPVTDDPIVSAVYDGAAKGRTWDAILDSPEMLAARLALEDRLERAGVGGHPDNNRVRLVWLVTMAVTAVEIWFANALAPSPIPSAELVFGVGSVLFFFLAVPAYAFFSTTVYSVRGRRLVRQTRRAHRQRSAWPGTDPDDVAIAAALDGVAAFRIRDPEFAERAGLTTWRERREPIR